MFELIVTDLEHVQGYIDDRWPTRIVSLLMDEMPDYGPQHLRLQFHDIARPIDGYWHPLPEHLQQLLQFTADLSDSDHVLVHCLQGVSRSTAAAIGILIQHGMSYQNAYNYVARQRPFLQPNTLLSRYIDEHFALGHTLLTMVEQNNFEQRQRYQSRLILPPF